MTNYPQQVGFENGQVALPLAIETAAWLTEPDEPNVEYERGISELLGDLFPLAGMELGDRAEQIRRAIRQRAREVRRG